MSEVVWTSCGCGARVNPVWGVFSGDNCDKRPGCEKLGSRDPKPDPVPEGHKPGDVYFVHDEPQPSPYIQTSGGGVRYDDGKARYDLIPPEAMEALAHHYRVGAKKYADRNWEKGMRWGRVFGSLMRHAWAFWRGETHDKDTGSHHMIAAAWNCIALFTYDKRKVGEDDRVKAEKGDRGD